MNYRHAYHAGNHTELLKHSALILILRHLAAKDKPFFVLDTHGGIGTYDLASEKVQKTREAEDGILRLARSGAPSVLVDFVRDFNEGVEIRRYPGSPAIIAAHLRANDRLAVCELHHDDIETLRRNMGYDPRVAVHHRDAYEGLNALVPPPERRGLVLIDPPYEKPDEEEALAKALIRAHRKWATGVFMAWYPIKSARPFEHLKQTLADAAIPGVLVAELTLAPADEVKLVGGGLVIINPPWKLDEQLTALTGDLKVALRAHRGRASVEWLTPPK
jgi:23S rRNA (adenine2030-N6)-methyltransferase